MNTQNVTAINAALGVNEANLEAALTQMAAKNADANVVGRAAVNGLIALGDTLYHRYGGESSETVQKLVATANKYLKSGNDAEFPSVKKFLVSITRMATDAKGEPNAVEYERVRQSWLNDVRQGKRWLAGEKKGKKGKKAVYSLAKALQAVETIFKRLKAEDDIDQVYRLTVRKYCKVKNLPVPEDCQEKKKKAA